MATNNETTMTATPRLRFPGFQKDWEPITVADFFDLNAISFKTESFNRERLLTVKLHANGVVQNEKATLTGGANYFTRRAGQFIFSKIDLLNGAFGIVPDALDGFSSSSDVPAYTFKEGQSSTFFLNWLRANYERLVIERTGTSSTLKRVSPQKFLALSLHAPSPAEQQKIAECLSSLDELIETQGRQVTAVAAHKRGLMQQLFPREGESRPRRRFPEFRDKGEWVKRRMADLLDRVSKPVDVDPTMLYREIGVRSHGKGVFHKESVSGKEIGNKRVFWVVPNAFVVNIIFAWEQAVATTTDAESGMIASHRFPMHTGKPGKCCVEFLNRAFLMPEGKRLLELASPGGAGRNRTLGQAEFEKIEMLLPEDVAEQQRIAACLSASDARLAAASEKLAALKAHRKGLMLRLFPAAEGKQ